MDLCYKVVTIGTVKLRSINTWMPGPYRLEYALGEVTQAPAGSQLFVFDLQEHAIRFAKKEINFGVVLECEHGVLTPAVHYACSSLHIKKFWEEYNAEVSKYSVPVLTFDSTLHVLITPWVKPVRMVWADPLFTQLVSME